MLRGFLGFAVRRPRGNSLARRHFAALFVSDAMTRMVLAAILWRKVPETAPAGDLRHVKQAGHVLMPFADPRYVLFPVLHLLVSLIFFPADRDEIAHAGPNGEKRLRHCHPCLLNGTSPCVTARTMSTMSSFLERRLARRFRAHDHDGNGFLERSDFEKAAVRMAEEFGHGPESPARQRFIEISLGVWQHLQKAADLNADGRISLAEYKTAFAAGLLETPESFTQGYVPYINAVVDIADQDRDGKLTASDQVRWVGSLMQVAEQDAREGFRRIDKDNDGLISGSEVVEAIRGYYFDESADSPGHWLIGPLDP